MNTTQPQNTKTNTYARVFKHNGVFAVSFLSILFVVSSYFVVQLKWPYAFTQLFTNTQNPQMLVAQLLVGAQTGVALFAGGLLAVVSLLLQQIVRNNLASDTTLAIGSGAQLSMLAVMVFFPQFAMFGSFWVAFIGALIAVGLVVAIALPSKLDPLIMILAGVVINILCTALISLVMVFYSNYINGLLLWAMGYLYQDNWQTLMLFTATALVTAIAVFLLKKPLTVMLLDDQQAKQLGVPINHVRGLVFILCALVTAIVVSQIGLIGFVGLGAATMVNVLRIQSVVTRMAVGFILGAMLLALTNNCIVILEHFIKLPKQIPAGVLTGLFGAPIILWLIIKQRKQQVKENITALVTPTKKVYWLQYVLALVLVTVVAIVFVNTNNGWQIQLTNIHNLFSDESVSMYRFVRTLTAATTGVMLAIAGLLLQRITQNPMASPEVLGISSASAMAIVFSFLLIPNITPVGIFGFGVLGSCTIMVILLWLMRFVPPSYLLMVGIAVAAIMNSLLMIIAFLDDPRTQLVLGWLSGSTYHAKPEVALLLLAISMATLLISIAMSKQINILSLNTTVAKSLGMSVRIVQTSILILIAIMSTFATMAIGPLSFVGLMVPHLARSLGATQIQAQLMLSAILGAVLMIIADWLGRYVIFPFEIAAGTLVSVIGCLYFLLLIKRMTN